jgi:host factor-I protein
MPRDRVIQDSFLETLRETDAVVPLYLLSGVRVAGRIDSFDQFAIWLKGNASKIIYKRAIATIVPQRDVGQPKGQRKAPALGD